MLGEELPSRRDHLRGKGLPADSVRPFSASFARPLSSNSAAEGSVTAHFRSIMNLPGRPYAAQLSKAPIETASA